MLVKSIHLLWGSLMSYFQRQRCDPMEYLAESIFYLADELAERRESLLTKQDLDNLEQRLDMKLSKIKADIATINSNLTEGLSEITTRLEQLVADNQDPEVTDEAFTAELEAALAKSNQLANTANAPVVTPPVEDTTGEPVTEPTPTPEVVPPQA